MRNYKNSRDYGCWLNYDLLPPAFLAKYEQQFPTMAVPRGMALTQSITAELRRGLGGLVGQVPNLVEREDEAAVALRLEDAAGSPEGFKLTVRAGEGLLKVLISSPGEQGLLYGTFAFLRSAAGEVEPGWELQESPRSPLRLINHWDNLDGSIERGYAGQSIFSRTITWWRT